MKNNYFSYGEVSEQRLYDDLVREFIEIYGLNCYYLPRKLVRYDKLFGEDINSQFNEAYIIEMYLETYMNFDGQGDLFTKFGVQINDQATFTVSKTRWEEIVSSSKNLITNKRPNEGDLIYYPLGKKLFQINFVEHETPFWQVADIQMYKMKCELFTYSQERIDTNIDTLDDFENKNSFTIRLRLKDVQGKFRKNEIVYYDGFEGLVANFDRSNNDLYIYSRKNNPEVEQIILGEDSGASGEIVSFYTMDEASRNFDSDNLFFEKENEKQWEFEEPNPFGEFQLDGFF